MKDIEDLNREIAADLQVRRSDNDPIGEKILRLRKAGRRFTHEVDGPKYRGVDWQIMACAMAAAWMYARTIGSEGDDLEFWFRKVVDESIVDDKVVDMDKKIVACSQFLVKQMMSEVNAMSCVDSIWLLKDIASLCARMAESREDEQARRSAAED